MAHALRGSSLVLAGLPPEGAEELLARYCSAGISSFLLPGRLLAEPRRLAALALAARKAAAAAGLGPALVALGGCATPEAAPPCLPDLPPPLQLAAIGGRRARLTVRRVAGLLGRILSEAGVDLVFGPCLDLATDPKRPGGVLGLFGEDPESVGRLGAAWVAGLAKARVSACGLSFPGAGSLSAEGRTGQRFVPFPLERLSEVEARPFVRTVARGLPAILVGRFLAPALEPERLPVARSARVIEGRLRGDLRFHGLVVGAELAEDPAGPARAAVLGALAGCDLAVTAAPETALEAAAALDAAVAAGELPAPRVLVSRARVEALRRGGVPLPGDAGSHNATDAGSALSDAMAELRASAAARGALVLRNGGGFPLPAGRALVLLFLPPEGSPESAGAAAAANALRELIPDSLHLEARADAAVGELMETARAMEGGSAPGGFAAALVLSCDAHLHPGQESLIRLAGERAPLSLVALRDPYDAAFFPDARALAATFGWSPACVRAAALLATGRLEARGTAPVSILGMEV